MRLQELCSDHYEDALQLSEYAFQYKVNKEDREKRFEMLKDHYIIGIYTDEQLSAKLHLLSKKVIVQGREFEMGGIAGVATYPEFRRNGYVTELIKHALLKMKENNQLLSFLHPFQVSFYRRYGWELFTDFKKVTIEQKDLRFVKGVNGTTQRFHAETHSSLIEDLYETYSLKFNGMLVRDEKWWIHSVYSNLTGALYFNEEGKAEGYLLYSIKDRKMRVEEIISLTPEAKLGLWNFICQHDSMISEVTVVTSKHDPFPYFIDQPRVKIEIEPYFMARIVDLQRFLNEFSFNAQQNPLILHVEDEYADWNSGTYFLTNDKITFHAKQQQGAACTQPPQRGIKASINTITALLLGYVTVNQAFECGLLKGNDEELHELSKWIPTQQSFFYDFF